jgi:hypothetical protein
VYPTFPQVCLNTLPDENEDKEDAKAVNGMLQARLYPTAPIPQPQTRSKKEGGYKAVWKREFKLAWREAGLLKSSR